MKLYKYVSESRYEEVKAIPLDKLKQEREKQYSKGAQALNNEKYLYAVKILDKLIAESEGTDDRNNN